MTPQISTDPSQSKRLMTAGLSYMTADMTLSHNNDGSYELTATPFHHGCFDERDLPSWSLPALLALLPSPLYEENRKQWSLQIAPTPHSEAWVIAYVDSHASLYQTNGATAIEAAVRMIETLVKNRIKLNDQCPDS